MRRTLWRVTGAVLAAGTLVTAVAFAGCASPTGAGSTSALRRGHALWVTECAQCHRPFWPGEYRPEQWQGIVRTMGRRASLGERDLFDLGAYLEAASRTAREPSRANAVLEPNDVDPEPSRE